MEQFLKKLQTLPEVSELIRRIEDGGCPAAVSGLQPVQRACVGAAAAAGSGRPAVFLCGDEREVQILAGDLETLTGARPVTLLGREWQFRPGAVGSREWERSRRAALYALSRGETAAVVATADALMARTLPPEMLRTLSFTLETGGRAELGALTERLISAGYARCDQVEGVGQFALRGGILDVFSPGMDQPVRCDFFDDEIDAMGVFDTLTQRRLRNVDQVRLLPVTELLGEARSSVFSLMGEGRALFLCESGRLAERVKGVLWQAREDTESLLERGEGADLTALLLREREWIPVHFWEKEVLRDLEGCVEEIEDIVLQQLVERQADLGPADPGPDEER